jgi:hypothetical protein
MKMRRLGELVIAMAVSAVAVYLTGPSIRVPNLNFSIISSRNEAME